MAKTPSNMERQHSHCDMYICILWSIFPHNLIKKVQNVQVWRAAIPKYLALKPLTPRALTLSKMEGQHSFCNMNIYKLLFIFVSSFIAIPFRFRSWMWRHYLDVENSKFKGQDSSNRIIIRIPTHCDLSWYQLNEISTKIQEKLWRQMDRRTAAV
jgi:hypothetical protein